MSIFVLKNVFCCMLCFLGDYVSTFDVKGKRCLQVEPEALTMISEQAMIDIAHLLRSAHLQVSYTMVCLVYPTVRIIYVIFIFQYKSCSCFKI